MPHGLILRFPKLFMLKVYTMGRAQSESAA